VYNLRQDEGVIKMEATYMPTSKINELAKQVFDIEANSILKIER
jgi:hypothetical protein